MPQITPTTPSARHAAQILALEIRSINSESPAQRPMKTELTPKAEALLAGNLARIQGKPLIANPYHPEDMVTALHWNEWKAGWEIEHWRLFKNPQWSVLRHSGRIRDHGHFRIAYRGTEQKARALYDKLATALRQGTVCLYDPFGTVATTSTAPRLQTRW